jgi:ATP-dependent DNA helicase RecG
MSLKLEQFLKSHENEILEFKAAERNFDFRELGKYFSALSNEANLKEKYNAWLIFGVNKNQKIIGTNFRKDREKLHSLKHEISKETTNNLSFIEIHEVQTEKGRVIMFEIPTAPQGIPIAFKGHYYARDGESIVPLNIEKTERIRSNSKMIDWSAQAYPEAIYEDLDSKAINFLREKLAKIKNNTEYKTIKLKNLLNRIGLLTNGKINNTCLLFLGKPEITNKYLFDKNKISWKYIDEKNSIEERLNIDQQIQPFILLIPEIQKNIHRFNTYLKDLDLFREDIRQYDEKAVEEILINAVVHRDWNIDLWIEVVQTPISLTVRNPGVFRADLEKVLKFNEKPDYLNKQMALFLQHLNLMEREGDGLRKVFKAQLSKGVRVYKKENIKNRVDIVLSGKVENIDFARNVLNWKSNLETEELLVLDSIASGKNRIESNIDKKIAKKMRENGIIDIDWKRNICNFSYIFSKKAGITGKRRRFEKLTKSQEEAEIINYLTENKKGQMKDFLQIFEYKGYTKDMVYNIFRRLKKKKKVRLYNRRIWILNDNVNNDKTPTQRQN